MQAIKIEVTGTQAEVTQPVTLTAGLVGQPVEFTFDEDWEGLAKTAVFRAGSRSYPVSCEQNAVAVPWEVLETPGIGLYIGVFGTDVEGTVRIPTVWAFADTIQAGTQIPDAIPSEATPTVYEQILSAANEAVAVANGLREDANSGAFNGTDGKDGADGYTPVRGVDYWTDADKAEIKSYVDEAILGGAW